MYGLFNASVTAPCPAAEPGPDESFNRESIYQNLKLKRGAEDGWASQPIPPAAPEATPPPAVVSVGNFITPQSLLSFPGAVLASQAIWAVLRSIFPAHLSGLWVPGLIGFLLGLGIMFYSLSDPNLATSGRDRIWGYVVGVVNSIFLSGAAMGVIAVGVGGVSKG